jgi:hypothetical protein
MQGNDFPFRLPRLTVYGFAALTLAGIGAFVAGAVRDMQQIWANALVVSYYILGLGLGGGVLLALCCVTGARWNATILPVLEKLTALLPAGAIGVGIVLAFRPSLYPWTSREMPGHAASAFQSAWLDRPFFLLRAFVYLASWLALTFLLVRVSRQHGVTPNAKKTRIAALFLVVFAVTCWLASTDWVMSFEPKWSSTAFGVYHFSGMFLSALAAVTILVLWFDRQGALPGPLTRNHLRDLGTLLFAFSSFWMYIWFSQYLLIWYVNNPEEGEYFVGRQQGAWQPLFLTNLVLNWGVPFVVLLFRPAKENSLVLLSVAVTVLVGRWLDLCLMILPPLAGAGPVFEIWDAGLVGGAVAGAALVLAWRSRQPDRALTSP